MSQSVGAKFGNVLAPSNRQLAHHHQQAPGLETLKASGGETFQRTTVRKSFKRRLPQQQQQNSTSNNQNIANQNVVPEQQPAPQSNAHQQQQQQQQRTGTKNSFGPDPPPSVARRNARERNRVKQVNTGFAVLRQHIPVLCGSVIVYGGSPHCTDPSSSGSPTGSNSSKKNKMSKVETLRCAVEYIRNLEKLLATGAPQQHDAADPECLRYGASPEVHQQESPVELGLSTSDDLSGFYDSSSSPESQSPADGQFQDQRFLFPFVESSSSPVLPTSDSKRIKTEQEPIVESDALFKQELLRTLSCWSEKRQQANSNQQLPDELLLEHQTESQPSAIQTMSDQSLFESLNSWWSANNL